MWSADDDLDARLVPHAADLRRALAARGLSRRPSLDDVADLVRHGR